MRSCKCVRGLFLGIIGYGVYGLSFLWLWLDLCVFEGLMDGLRFNLFGCIYFVYIYKTEIDR